MPHEQPTDDAPAHDTAVQEPHATAQTYEQTEGPEQWYDDPVEDELPRRPRRRLLTPVPLALAGVLLIACGFIGGVLVQKGQTASTSPAAVGSLASRFGALRSSATSGSSSARGGTGASAASAFGGGAGSAGGGGATVGQVAYVSGHSLYVTTAEGNTVKVTTSEASTVTKTVKANVKSIHPGETVIVTGSTGSNGAISAESIRVSEAGGGGLGALFGAGGGGSGGRGARGGGGEPALFGG